MEIFGFEITRKKEELRVKDVQKKSRSALFLATCRNDGTPVIQQILSGFISGGAYGSMLIWKAVSRMRLHLFKDTVKHLLCIKNVIFAIDDIVNECIVSDTQDRIVSLDLRDVELSDSIKEKMHNEFKTIYL